MSTVEKPPSQSRERSPLLAGLFSLLIPGLGHIYTGGARYRGIAVFISTVVTLVTVIWYNIAGWYLNTCDYLVVECLGCDKPDQGEEKTRSNNRSSDFGYGLWDRLAGHTNRPIRIDQEP